MRYIVSDIHGCYNEYIRLLDKIQFSWDDTLYVLGDIVDRGPEPIRVLTDIMKRPNVIHIMGNHDYLMYTFMKKPAVEISAQSDDYFLAYYLWLQDGGWVTVRQFEELPTDKKKAILGYLLEAYLYEVIEYNGKKYILVHAGLDNFAPDKALEDYDMYDFLEKRTDYGERYYPDENTYLVTGHTPTIYIEGWEKPEVYRKNGHIAIDCGCVNGGRLAAFCIETEEVMYVEGR